MSAQRELFTAMPLSRLEFLCRLHGSADGSADGVPEDRREELQEHIDFHDQLRLATFENLCRRFGPTGFFEDIPAEKQAETALWFEELAAHFNNDCEFELRISRIEKEEEEAAAAAVAPKRKRR